MRFSASPVPATDSLVPDLPGTTPNYWCTWAVQNYMHGQGAVSVDPQELEGAGGAALARAHLNEQELLGRAGWAERFYPQARRDLYLVLDDGWDVPLRDTGGWYSSFILNREKFFSFAWLPPAERLKRLNESARALGWRGIGLWLAAQEADAVRGTLTTEQYWAERARWCREAGIDYWKADWGTKSTDVAFRRLQTDVARAEHPALIVEHAIGHLPFNGLPRIDPQWIAQVQSLCAFSAVVRLYDLSPQLSVPAMLDRVAFALHAAPAAGSPGALLNCDDEPVIAAVLGACMGVLRHPLTGLRASGDPDLFFSGPRRQKRRMDEVTRAVRWQRIAPAFAGGSAIAIDDARLTDSWNFRRGDFWWGIGQLIKQAAPARIARGLPLPVVRSAGEKPYVIASRHPNGAVAVATLGRMAHDRGWSEPRADVTLPVGELPPALGVFGRFASLALTFDQPLQPGQGILAQDLAGDTPVDITARCRIDGRTLTLPGELIDTIGLSAASPGDLSEPGLVLAFRT